MFPYLEREGWSHWAPGIQAIGVKTENFEPTAEHEPRGTEREIPRIKTKQTTEQRRREAEPTRRER